MRASSILTEALADLKTGTSRAVVFAAVLIALVGTLALVDVRSVAGALAAADTFRAGGGHVSMIDGTGQIDGGRCAAVASRDDVDAAGAARIGGDLTALAMPTSRIPVLDVTPGVFDVLAGATPVRPGSSGTAAGLWLSDDIAGRLGAGPGDLIPTTEGDVSVAGVYTWPDDGRDRGLGFAALAPVPASGTFDRCLATLRDSAGDAAAILMFTARTDDLAQLRVTRLNGTLAASLDTDAALAGRPTRWGAAAAAAIGFAVGFSATRARRLEIASALHARTRKADLGWIHALQTAAWSLAGVLVIVALTTWAARATGLVAWRIPWVAGLRIAATGTLTPVIGTVLAIATTRERHLTVYFRNR